MDVMLKSHEEQNKQAKRILTYVKKVKKSDKDRHIKLSHALTQLSHLTIADKELLSNIEKVIKEKSWEFEQ